MGKDLVLVKITKIFDLASKYVSHTYSYLQKPYPAGKKWGFVVRKHQEPEADRHLDGQRLLSPFQPEPEGEAVEVLEGRRIRPDLGHRVGQTSLEASQGVCSE